MGISNNASGLRPGVCTSTTRPTAPYNGQLIYETDTKKVYIYNGTSWVEQPTAGMVDAKGDLLVGTAADTAARLAVGTNDQVLVAASGETTGLKWATLGAWTTYTPTWTNLTVGNATQSFAYLKINNLGFIQGELTFGSTTSITASNPRFTLPSGWTNEYQPLSSFIDYLDAGVTNYDGWLNRWDNDELLPMVGLTGGTYYQGQGLSSTVPMTWGTSDVMKVGAVMRLS